MPSVHRIDVRGASAEAKGDGPSGLSVPETAAAMESILVAATGAVPGMEHTALALRGHNGQVGTIAASDELAAAAAPMIEAATPR